jgi:hypothetical protein
VAAFIKDDGLLPDLEQSWFDAAYWFHEGLAEPVETIAVAKLETALEVLLSSASTKGSTSRLTDVFSSFYGRHKDQPIADGSAVMVKDFVNEIVSSRSRVLAWFAIAAAFSSVPVFLR